jgi:hypothetical protein
LTVGRSQFSLDRLAMPHSFFDNGQGKGQGIMSTKTGSQIDVVFIRKSTQAQDDQGQKDNVRLMLNDLGVSVPEESWFVGTVSRRKVKANVQFRRLMELIEADRVNTVYVETQDRWGTSDRVELFHLLGTLRDHGTRLYDLRAKKDLTEKDFATEMLAILSSFKSEKELQDISNRSLRSRVSIFQDLGSWPTGTHPYGYGKRCYAADGKLLWEWQPVNRSKGQIFYPDAKGKLTPGPTNVSIPRKTKGARDKTVLVPANNADYVRAVWLIFDLYTRVGLSRRQVSARLNAEGLTFNGGPFTHPDVTNILRNPAYVGDTHFGKVQTGALHTFDPKGVIVEIKGKQANKRRAVSECLVKKDTHQGLVDRKTWELAQKKLEDERQRTSYAPRNPAYYLKQLFVCGHCGKGLTGRMETHPRTREKTVVYVCPTYVAGRCNGHPVACGYHRITHYDAERLLLDKIRELNLPLEQVTSGGARSNLEARLERLGHESDEYADHWGESIEAGVTAFLDYLRENYRMRPEHLQRLEKTARMFYSCGWLTRTQVAGLPATPTGHLPTPAEANKVRTLSAKHNAALAQFKQALQEAEEVAVAVAQKTVAKLRQDHKALTLAWAKASELQQGVLREEVQRLEGEIHEWEPRTVPLGERVKALLDAEAERNAERQKLLAEWPALESREKGEALRRLFQTITLFWRRTFHPAMTQPSRPRRTNRPGRYSYDLKKDETRWALTPDLVSSR